MAGFRVLGFRVWGWQGAANFPKRSETADEESLQHLTATSRKLQSASDSQRFGLLADNLKS